ncbi:hypothetical protein ES708_32227 [subsurface metagenome]
MMKGNAKIASDIPLSDSSSPSDTERKNGNAVKMNPIWSLSNRLKIPGTTNSGFFLGNIGITLGPIIFGVLIPIMGMSYAFVVVGILELITLAANIILVRTVFKDKIT